MTQRHVIGLALDLARMPALARTSAPPPIPSNVIELMRIAAASPDACQEAAAATGEPVQIVMEAARFYLQQSLFRPEADCYRILGIRPGTPRATARKHMRLLLEWLHPDRNSDLDAVYAERVLKAWRGISEREKVSPSDHADAKLNRHRGAASSFRLPWIESQEKRQRANVGTALWAVRRLALPAGLVIVLLALCSALYYFAPEQTIAMIRAR